MASIKSYSDLQQSKKLAEILPLESADMTYCAITEGMREKMIIKDWKVNTGLDIAIKENLFSYRNGYMLPCWSLAALLSIFEDKGFYYKLYFDGVFNVLEVTNIDNPNIHEMNYNDYSIDVCVAMIEKLHKLNLL